MKFEKSKQYQNPILILFKIQFFLSLFTFSIQSKNLRNLETILTFSDDSITETSSGSGYSREGSTLTISSAGTYTIKGSSSGNIIVSSSLSGVILILNGLALTSSSSTPTIEVKASSTVNIQLTGQSTLTNSDDNSGSCSGSVIKLNSGSSLVISGASGQLTLAGSCADGISGLQTSSVTLNSGTVIINSKGYGISAYGSVNINDGTLTITSVYTGITTNPPTSDTSSKGTITISGGTTKVTTSGTSSDGIQAASALTITGGTIDITVLSGYDDSEYDYNTMTCVGLYANNTLNSNSDSSFSISGGDIKINAPGSGISSAGTLTITGGTIEINSANDGIHADTTLVLGKQSGSDSDYSIDIKKSYEGIEALTINMYSGTVNIYSTDDGINAQTVDSYDNQDETSEGGPGGQGGPGNRRLDDTPSINLYGGKLYLNADGDGLDSNGNLYIYGGNIEVWGAASGGDDEPFDHDEDLTISDATVFAAGSQGTEYLHNGIDSINQGYIYSTSSFSSGATIIVKNGDTEVYETSAPKNGDYIFYTTSNINSDYKIYVDSTEITTTYGSSISSSSSNSDSSNSDSSSHEFIKIGNLFFILLFSFL